MVQTYLNQETITIKRQSYVGSKSSFSDLATVKAYVRPLTEEQLSVNELQFGQGQFVMVSDTVDVQEGDKILFDGKDYTVRGVSPHTRGISLPKFKQLLIVLGTKN